MDATRSRSNPGGVRDVLSILKVQGQRLDIDYMRQWAKELGVPDLLEQAISEARSVDDGV